MQGIQPLLYESRRFFPTFRGVKMLGLQMFFIVFHRHSDFLLYLCQT